MFARFRWVTCQLDYLCGFSSDFERRSALGQLPPTLHGTYLRLLQRFCAMPAPTQSKIQMCLNFIAFSPFRLTINQLRSAISTPEVIGSRLDDDSMVSREDIAYMCGSLLRMTEDGRFFEFAHFSVREFLEHESLAGMPGLKMYHISLEKSNEMLAVQSLRFVQLSNFDVEFSDPKSLTTYVLNAINQRESAGVGFHGLAARLSAQLSGIVNPDSTSTSLTKSLFQPRKSSCFLLFATRFCFDLTIHLIRNELIQPKGVDTYSKLAQKLLRDDFRPLHLAAALNLPDVCLNLIAAGSDLEAESSFGTPFELSYASFLGILFNDCDPTLIEKHHRRLYDPMCGLLDKSHQRNATFEIFEHRHFEEVAVDSTRQSRDDALVLQAAIISFAGNNFCVLQKLLSRGMTLDDTIYTRLFPDLMSQSLPDIQRNEKPLLSFLQCLGSMLGAESGWPLEIGRVVWNTAVELELHFTRDPTVTDSRISLSKDALVSRAFTTIKRHDMEGLRECLADGRLDLSERHRDPLEPHDEDDPLHLTLLHFAVLENNLDATKALAQAGCDPNIPAIQTHHRYLPVHDCFRLDILEELLLSGASVTDVEIYRGKNMWHFYGSTSEPATEFFDSVARRFPSETAEALLTESKEGYTPLQLLLEFQDWQLARDDHVERVIALIEICEGIADFWSRHDPILGAAAAFGSEKVIRRLIEVGATSETIGTGLETPLHLISIESSSASVQCLKEVFPEAMHVRFEDRLPLQAYLEKCLQGNHPIDDSVAQQLLTAGALESVDGRGTSLWEYYCTFDTKNRSFSNQSASAMMWAWLLGKSFAMQVYEKGTGKNGLVLILSRLVTLKGIGNLASMVPSHVLEHAMDATDRWETIKSDSNVLRFLQFAIKKRAYSLVSLLVERGVSVHDQVDGYSSFQIAFQSPLVVKLCSDEEGKYLLLDMVDHAAPEYLNGYDRDGLTILHTLATKDSDGGHGLHWLIGALMREGVDDNRIGALQNQRTPMAHHVREGSISCATYLLEVGADPGLARDSWPDAVLEASAQGSVTFLRKALDHSKTSGMPIDWHRKSGLSLESRTGNVITVTDANAIHYASTNNNLEVLEWYVENRLIEDLEIVSARDWTGMHCAAFDGHASIIQYLASKGCDTMPETTEKTTPLHMSVGEEHYEATEALIRLGAKDVPNKYGETPTRYASENNNGSILRLLDELLASETSHAHESARDSLPRHRLKALTKALVKAIKSGDMKECKRLYAIGCPVNSSIRGWSPLGLALRHDRLAIAEWLLDNGAETSAHICQANDDLCTDVMEICLGRPKLCKLIPKLAERCIHDGSGWPLVENRSFLSAVRKKNTEGLSILLKLLTEWALHIRYRNLHCLA